MPRLLSTIQAQWRHMKNCFISCRPYLYAIFIRIICPPARRSAVLNKSMSPSCRCSTIGLTWRPAWPTTVWMAPVSASSGTAPDSGQTGTYGAVNFSQGIWNLFNGVLLPGGDRAVREIGRIALALAKDAGLDNLSCVPLPEEKCRMLSALIDMSPSSLPAASSIGRLFDGVCALILGRSEIDYEGEGAALVEDQ